MKALSISAIVLTLVTAPASAGLMTSEEGDQQARCGLKSARMIVNGSEEIVIFPEDVTNCRELDGEAGNDSKNDSLRFEPANSSAGSEPSLDLVTLAPAASR